MTKLKYLPSKNIRCRCLLDEKNICSRSLKRDPNDNYWSEETDVMERICNLSVPDFRSDRLYYKIRLWNVKMIIQYICRFAENSNIVLCIYCSPPDCCEGFQDYIWSVHFKRKHTLLPMLHVIVNNLFECSYSPWHDFYCAII